MKTLRTRPSRLHRTPRLGPALSRAQAPDLSILQSSWSSPALAVGMPI